MKKLNKKDIEIRFGKKYLSMLSENKWIQSYMPKKNPWPMHVDDIWLPGTDFLWNIVETYIPVDPQNEDVQKVLNNKIEVTKKDGKFIVVIKLPSKKLTSSGESIEEALLKMWVKLELN